MVSIRLMGADAAARRVVSRCAKTRSLHARRYASAKMQRPPTKCGGRDCLGKAEVKRGASGAILLDARGAQAGEAVAVDRILPRQEFRDRERIAGAGLFQRQETA